jgi:hypothetical protein
MKQNDGTNNELQEDIKYDGDSFQAAMRSSEAWRRLKLRYACFRIAIELDAIA